MWGWENWTGKARTETEPEDDEILVYDWKNAAVPRPAGTTKLLESPSRADRKFRSPAQIPRVATNNFGDNVRNYEVPPYQPSVSGSNGFSPYFDSRHFSSWNSHQYYQTGEFNLFPQTRSSYTQLPHSNFRTGSRDSWNSNGTFSETRKTQNTSQEIAREDDDWFDVEEIDYSEHSGQGQYSRTLNNDNNDMVAETEASKSSTLCVPKPNLPLIEVLPELPHKSARLPTTTTNGQIRNIRKRPRNDIGDSSDLEGLLCKTKHRVSSRSYAKPTRRVDSTTTTSSTTEIFSNKRQSQLAPVLLDGNNDNDSTTSSALTDSSHRSNEYEDDTEDSSITSDLAISNLSVVSNNSIDVINDAHIDIADEPDVEPKLKIRTDIFEEEDE